MPNRGVRVRIRLILLLRRLLAYPRAGPVPGVAERQNHLSEPCPGGVPAHALYLPGFADDDRQARLSTIFLLRLKVQSISCVGAF